MWRFATTNKNKNLSLSLSAIHQSLYYSSKRANAKPPSIISARRAPVARGARAENQSARAGMQQVARALLDGRLSTMQTLERRGGPCLVLVLVRELSTGASAV